MASNNMQGGGYGQYEQGIEQRAFGHGDTQPMGQTGYQNTGPPGYQNAGQHGYQNDGHNGYQNTGQQEYPNTGQQGYQQNGYQNAEQNGYQNAGNNGYQNAGQNGYQNAGQNGRPNAGPKTGTAASAAPDSLHKFLDRVEKKFGGERFNNPDNDAKNQELNENIIKKLKQVMKIVIQKAPGLLMRYAR